MVSKLAKELKINIFFAIADLSIHYPRAIVPHFDHIIRITQMALMAVIHFMNSNNPEFVNYAESLKESLIDCYLCLTHAVYLPMDIKDKEFEDAFVKLQEFLKITCQRNLNPTIDYLRNCLGLIFDIFSKKKNRNLLDVEFARYLYDFVAMYPKHQDVPQILEFAKIQLDNL